MSDHISVAKEIREEQRQALSTMTPREKLKYFWDYYKIHTIAVILACAVIAGIAYELATAKDYNFYGVMMNTYGIDSGELAQAFGEYAGLDMENYESFLDTSSTLSLTSPSEYDMATSQKLMAMIQSQELDMLITTQEIFNNYAGSELFLDLRTILSPEDLEKYQDHFFYVDAAVFEKEEEEEFDYNMEYKTAEEYIAEAETHRNPEGMEKPVPVGIYVSHSPFIQETHCYPETAQAVYGIIVNTTRPDTAVRFLDFLFSGEVPEFTESLF